MNKQGALKVEYEILVSKTDEVRSLLLLCSINSNELFSEISITVSMRLQMRFLYLIFPMKSSFLVSMGSSKER